MYRYFFYISNLPKETATAEGIVFHANDRCDQENLIEQLKNGVHALRCPVDNLYSNWAYMVMAGLAWSMKAWLALSLPAEPGRWQDQHKEEKHTLLRMHFKKFLNAFVRIPCQVVKTGRRVALRLLSWNPWQRVFFRLSDALRC